MRVSGLGFGAWGFRCLGPRALGFGILGAPSWYLVSSQGRFMAPGVGDPLITPSKSLVTQGPIPLKAARDHIQAPSNYTSIVRASKAPKGTFMGGG